MPKYIPAHPNSKDLTNQRFGRLIVLECAGKTATGRLRWHCHCDCGNDTVVIGKELRSGHTSSCGCLAHQSAHNAKELVGQKFGRLLVLENVGRSSHNRLLWRCGCDCGNEITVASSNLLNGNTRSCGCLHRQEVTERMTTHGKHGTRLYRLWRGVVNRCTNPNASGYARYGGNGVNLCDEWQHDFQAFFNHVSPLAHFGEQGYSLDRIDNYVGYKPGNVRWATRVEQARNKRKNNPQP